MSEENKDNLEVESLDVVAVDSVEPAASVTDDLPTDVNVETVEPPISPAIPVEVELAAAEPDLPIEVNEVSSEISEEEVIAAVPLETEDAIRARIAVSEENIARIRSQVSQLGDRREEVQNEVEEIVATREDLNQWVDTRKESFAWRLVDSLRKYASELTADENYIKDFSENPPVFDPEFASKIRKWVMKSFSISTSIYLIVIFILNTIRNNIGTIEVPDPNNPAVSLQINKYDNWLLGNLGISHRQLLSILTLTITLFFIGIFFAYSRKTSDNRQIIAMEAQKAKDIETAVYNVKIERERLDSLHPQIPQILELLSLGLHQPWKIDEKYSNFQGQLPDASKIPESLDISIPTKESAKKVFSQLVFLTMNEIQKPGWRETAFNKVIQKLAESAGFGHGGEALSELDADQRRSGKRQMLIDLEDKESVMLSIGDELVSQLASEVQKVVLQSAQPEVVSLRPDPLSELLLSDSLVKQSSQPLSHWEDKLLEIAGQGSPWGVSTFSGKGQVAARHEQLPDSLLIGTGRVCGRAHSGLIKFVEVVSDTRPSEVSIRVDLSPWCNAEELAIFQDYEPSASELEARESRERLSQAAANPDSEEDTGVAF